MLPHLYLMNQTLSKVSIDLHITNHLCIQMIVTNDQCKVFYGDISSLKCWCNIIQQFTFYPLIGVSPFLDWKHEFLFLGKMYKPLKRGWVPINFVCITVIGVRSPSSSIHRPSFTFCLNSFDTFYVYLSWIFCEIIRSYPHGWLNAFTAETFHGKQ